MTLFLRQSTAVDIRVGPFVDATDAVTPETGITLAAADQAEVLKANGAATVAMAGAFVAVTGADGWYDYTVATGDVDTVGEVVFVVQDLSVALPVFVRAMVVEEAVFDNLYAAAAVGPLTAAAVNAQVDIALADYDGPTNAEMIARTILAADYFDPAADTVALAAAQGPVTFTGVTDEAGITLVGAGTGPGLSSTGGATGHGAALVGGATSGDGLNAAANGDGKGADLIGVGANAGLRAEGGATGPGIHAHGGVTGATPGVEFHAHSASGDALSLAVDGTGDASPELVRGVWDRELTGATHNIPNSAGRRLRQIEASFVITSGTAQAGTANTITLAAGESAVNNIFAGDRVIIVAGTGIGEHGIAISYDGTTKICIMSQNWVITPDPTSEYELAPADVDVETWQHVTVSISPTTNLPEVDTKSVSDDLVAADNIELDYDGTGFDKANSTIGTTTANTDMVAEAPTTAQINAEVVDVLTVDTTTLPGQGAPPLAPTIEGMLAWIYKTFRNKKEQTTTEWRLYDDAGTVVDSKATVSAAAGVTTKEEIGTGP